MADEACSQKDRDQDIALLRLETAHARHDEWQAAHTHIHRLEASSITLAREAMEKRLDGMNELRGALKDAQSTMITRENYEQHHELLASRLDLIERSFSARIGNIERLMPIVVLVAGGIAAAISAALLRAFGG